MKKFDLILTIALFVSGFSCSDEPKTLIQDHKTLSATVDSRTFDYKPDHISIQDEIENLPSGFSNVTITPGNDKELNGVVSVKGNGPFTTAKYKRRARSYVW